jgi:hypothetical protein
MERYAHKLPFAVLDQYGMRNPARCLRNFEQVPHIPIYYMGKLLRRIFLQTVTCLQGSDPRRKEIQGKITLQKSRPKIAGETFHFSLSQDYGIWYTTCKRKRLLRNLSPSAANQLRGARTGGHTRAYDLLRKSRYELAKHDCAPRIVYILRKGRDWETIMV